MAITEKKSAGQEYLDTMTGIESTPITSQNITDKMSELSFLTPPETNANFYDLASELGAGLLSTPNTGGASAFVGLGVGFHNFSQGVKKRQEARNKFNQQLKQLAYQSLEKTRLAQLDLRKEAATMDFKIKLEYAKRGEGALFGGLNTAEGRALDFVLRAQQDPTLTTRDPESYNAAVNLLNSPRYIQVVTEAGISLQPVPGKYSGVAPKTDIQVGATRTWDGNTYIFNGGNPNDINSWAKVIN
mgnify:CR=1 FL=1